MKVQGLCDCTLARAAGCFSHSYPQAAATPAWPQANMLPLACLAVMTAPRLTGPDGDEDRTGGSRRSEAFLRRQTASAHLVCERHLFPTPFTDGEREAQRGAFPCPGSHSWLGQS